MVKLETLRYLSTETDQFIKITDDVLRVARESGVRDGLVAVISAHTTTGIVVNEGLPCVEKDLGSTLDRLVPLDEPYAHAHFLPSYGATGNNSCGHIKSMLVGNSCMFPIADGEVVRGGAQDVYLAEFDGPQARKVHVEVIGE
ncbi:MAG: secondary thiamine-phosphate synthase enzyme YjbQ [Atopobiaceae bacterium]|jgi:secondary thiamine-phosphate synthase enzyme|nr:secondary thiamine-phosphate synthase enzyme YjbQ [Atopobiaceae bacterium]MCI2172642.1 secondary thiamine-phosphate synthase enzyme YjbQ [Atopobiaceae bacterium]MCI2206949.1 secondary thiamine-phosphate synthase enzyme YjbQ [Atopobiaceae bacterium]